MHVNLDFETRNTVDIKAGASKYAETAEILCLAYSINNGEIKTWRPIEPYPQDLLDAIEFGAEVRAWNASFERAIWLKVMQRHYDWPKVQKWRCTMAAALACGLPGSLENAAKALKLDVEKDMAGRRLMLKMTKPCEVKIPLDPSKYKILLIDLGFKQAKQLAKFGFQFTTSQEYVPGYDIVIADSDFDVSVCDGGPIAIKTNMGSSEVAFPHFATKRAITKTVIVKAMQSLRKFRNEPTKKMGWHEKEEDFQKLLAYCAQDVRTEMAVDAIIPKLWKTEEGVYEYDATVNARGVKFDRPLVESCIKVWNKYLKSLNDEMEQITFGGATTSEVAKILSILQSIGVPIGTLDKRAVASALNIEGISPTGKRMLEIRQLAAKSSVSKFKRILQCIESDDRIRGCTQYHGAARTGRYAGRYIQLQNLLRGIVPEDQIENVVNAILAGDVEALKAFGPIGDVIGSMVRCSIIADDGKKLIPFDFSSIEARCLAWTAGEEWLLEAFAKGEDAYKHMASSIFKVSYDQVNKDQRWWGKTVILGAGYMLGADGLLRQLEAAGVKAERDFAAKLIEAYRAKNKRIVSHWYSVERAAIDCVQSGRPHSVWPFTYHMKDRWLCCRLPSGRDIRYLDPKLVPGRFDKMQIQFTGTDVSGKPIREMTYSGKLVENNTQAVCRDILVHAKSRLERHGYPIIFHVHDEVVPEVPKEFGSVDEVRKIMTEVPEWATGFPIDAEGFETKRYRK